MGVLSDFLARRRKARVNRALEATLKPDPDFRARRLAQFSAERRQRYFENVERIGHG